MSRQYTQCPASGGEVGHRRTEGGGGNDRCPIKERVELLATICTITSTIKTERKIALPTRYPLLTMTSALSQVMVTVSPAVSPSVVARNLITQKPRVTSGTLLA